MHHPNRFESSLATGLTIESPADGLKAARQLCKLGIDNVIVTLDRDGMAWADRAGRGGIFSVRQREVYDITGAGDMVLSVIGYCLASGIDYPQLIELANLAGGLEVEQLGVVPLSRQDLLAEVGGQRSSRRHKVVTIDELRTALLPARQAGQRIVLTNGCFDLLHPGHLASLEAARRLGDCLVVALNSDQSVRALKGPGRPVIDEQGRAELLAGLACVDYVVLFDDTSVAPVVAEIRPDVLSKSAEYERNEVVGYEIVES